VKRIFAAAVAVTIGASPALAEAPFPRHAVKEYCQAAGDTMPATFGDVDWTNGPTEWRCVHGAAYTCGAGVDGSACSALSNWTRLR
jgi:hypothetical protein